MMETLKAQQLIVMVALFVSLVGTLLLLGKINAHGEPVTTASAVMEITVPKESTAHAEAAVSENNAVVHVIGNIGNNETEET